MKTLVMDIETFSPVSLPTCGVDRYVEDDEFQILLFAYSVDGGSVEIIDLANGEVLPLEIRQAIVDESVTKWAHNSRFERICLSRYLGEYLDPESWRCSMAACAYITLPLSLEAAAKVINATEKKAETGKALIKYFCTPCAPTMANGKRTRNLPSHDPEKWTQFKEYCKQDVVTEIAVMDRLKKHPMPENEWRNFVLNERINDRGIRIDRQLVDQAIQFDARSRAELVDKLKALTGKDNPNSALQIRQWLADQGTVTDSIGKPIIKELMQVAPDKVAKVLSLRQELAKSSIAKYQAMRNVVCEDGRFHGGFQFYRASRTGRAAGRIINLQNLPQQHMPNLEEARQLLLDGNYEALEAMCGSIPTTLSELIRSAFIPMPGRKFVCVDFTSIEAVVLAWAAGEDWVLRAYEAKEDLYIRNAERMFGAEPGTVTKGSEMRQKSKIAILSCGYGGGVGALKRMGANHMGLSDSELQPLVNAWRKANPNIVKLWRDVDKAAKATIRKKSYADLGCLSFEYLGKMLCIKLPSGRRLYYIKPKIETNSKGYDEITYEGVGPQHKWSRINTYGAKLVENCIQAIARDILFDAMQRLHATGLDIVLHCHDEAVLEASPKVSLEAVCELMARTPPWAKGLPLRADGYESFFYKKG